MKKIDFKKIINTIEKNKLYLISILVIFIILGFVYTFKIVKEEYKSYATLIVGLATDSEMQSLDKKISSGVIQSKAKINSRTIATYSELIKSNNSINKIKNNLGINIENNELKKSINVNRVFGTDLIEISVKYPDSKIACNITNEATKVFSEKIKEIYKLDQIYIVDYAVASTEPYNVHHILDILIFLTFGIVIEILYIIVVANFDKTIKSAENIEEAGLKTLISIPNKKNKKKDLEKLIDLENKKSQVLDAFKNLRTNIQFININNKKNKVILVTSCFTGEGKSYISANLAAVFAKAGKKVIIIDMDMRLGRQSIIFGLPNNLGVSNYLSNIDANGMEINERINSYIRETSIKNLNVITSGTVPPNSSELLTSEKLPELIKDLSVFYDLIIIDGAPVLPVVDTLILTKLAGSTILVSSENKTKIDELEKAKRSLQNVGGKIIGVVLNQSSIVDKKSKILKIKDKKQIHKNLIESNKKEKNKTNSFKERKKIVKNKFLKVKNVIINKINSAIYRKKEKLLLLEQTKELKENFIENQMMIEEYEKSSIQEETRKVTIIEENEKQKKKIEEENKNIKNESDTIKKQKGIKKENIKEEKKETENDNDSENDNIKKEELKNNLINKEKIKIIFKNSKDKVVIVLKKYVSEIENRFKKIKITILNKKQNIKECIFTKREEKLQNQKQKDEEIEKEKLVIKEEGIDLEKDNAILDESEEQELLEQENSILEEIKEESLEKEKEIEEKKSKKELKRKEKKNKRIQEREERKKYKEQKRKQQQEEARIQEELQEDNLYPKTKYNKNL